MHMTLIWGYVAYVYEWLIYVWVFDLCPGTCHLFPSVSLMFDFVVFGCECATYVDVLGRYVFIAYVVAMCVCVCVVYVDPTPTPP